MGELTHEVLQVEVSWYKALDQFHIDVNAYRNDKPDDKTWTVLESYKFQTLTKEVWAEAIQVFESYASGLFAAHGTQLQLFDDPPW